MQEESALSDDILCDDWLARYKDVTFLDIESSQSFIHLLQLNRYYAEFFERHPQLTFGAVARYFFRPIEKLQQRIRKNLVSHFGLQRTVPVVGLQVRGYYVPRNTAFDSFTRCGEVRALALAEPCEGAPCGGAFDDCAPCRSAFRQCRA